MSSGTSKPEEATLTQLAESLQEVTRILQERSDESRVREKAFDKLYQELSQYKEDFLYQAEKPLLLDLLLYYDSLSWFQTSLVKQEISPEVIADSFQYLVDEFLELLYRRDVVPVEAKTSFDRTIHKAMKVVSTTELGKDQTVQQVLKRGFRRGKRILRPEEVVIHRAAKDAS